MTEQAPLINESWIFATKLLAFLMLCTALAILVRIARDWLRNLTTDLRAFVLSRFRPTSSRPERNSPQ